MSYFKLELSEDEEVVKIVRRHPITLTKPILEALIVIIFSLLFWDKVIRYDWGMVITVSIIILAILYLFWQWIVWHLDAAIITDYRIIDIDQKNLINRIVSEVALSQISSVFYEIRGIVATLFGFGTVRIQTMTNNSLELNNISEPQKVQELIVKLKNNHAQKSI